MFLLGLAAIVQIVFLPGYLTLRLMRLRLGIIGTLLCSFALSLIVNHFLVWGLVLAGIYRSGVIYGVFAAEILLLLVLVRRFAEVTVADSLRQLGRSLQATCKDYLPRDLDDKAGLLRMAVFFAVMVLMIGYVVYELMPPDRIFSAWDAVVSWNRWAGEWAQNQLPINTAEYPQLLPANLSLTYVFIQDTSVWFFAKAIMFLFCLGTLLAIFDLGLRSKQIGYLLGVIFTFMLFHAILRARNLGNGYADVPAAFFAFASVYILLRSRLACDNTFKHLLLAAMFAAGAALTKQVGLFLVVVFPLLAHSFHKAATGGRGFSGATTGRGFMGTIKNWVSYFRPKGLVFATLCIIAFIAPWYLYKQWQIHLGGDCTVAPYLVQEIHAGRSALQRLVHAVGLLQEHLSLSGMVFFAIALAGTCRDPVGRRLVGLIVVPFTLIWCFAFSYDTRNLALAIPFAGMASGIGVMVILQALERRLARRGSTLFRWVPNLLAAPAGAAVLLLLAALAVFGSRISSKDLLARQEVLQKQIGLCDINEGLYAYEREQGFASAIASDYYCLAWLPELNRHYRICTTRDLPAFRATYERPEVGYALLHKEKTAADVQDYIERARNKGKVRVVLDTRYYRLYQKLKVR